MSKARKERTPHNTSLNHSLNERIIELLEFIYGKPDIEELSGFLATSICPSGELCRVHVARLDQDRVFRTAAHFGYPVNCPIATWEIPMNEDRPSVLAYRSGENILINAAEVVARYKHFVNIDPASPWGSSILLPTKHPLVFGFRRQVAIQEEERGTLEGYFAVVRRILNLWPGKDETNQDRTSSNSMSDSMRKKSLLGVDLTERQRVILRFIERGLTNAQIAEEIAYSESLVRQETVIIYAKLGVPGRKTLISA